MNESSASEKTRQNQDKLNQAIENEQSRETRDALLAIINLAIFLLLWGGTSVWGLFTGWSWPVKTGIIIGSFVFWGVIVNRVFIRLTHGRPS